MALKLPKLIHGRTGVRRFLARAALGLMTTFFVLGHIAGNYTIPYIDEIENLLYDSRVRLSAPRDVDERIVIVAIDETSLNRHGHWPWTRDKLALLLEQMFAYGVMVVGFDILFAGYIA